MYTKDFFGANGTNWIIWLGELAQKPNLNFLEIGCFEGKATVWLLEHIITDSTSRITVIDTFKGSREHKIQKLDVSTMYQNFLKNTAEFKDKITIHVGSSQKILRTFLVGQFDFIYIDGSHQAPDVLEDTLLAWRLLKKGGILIWDDYDWGEQYQEREKPKVAIDAFLYIFEGKYQIISSHRQICVTKLEL